MNKGFQSRRDGWLDGRQLQWPLPSPSPQFPMAQLPSIPPTASYSFINFITPSPNSCHQPNHQPQKNACSNGVARNIQNCTKSEETCESRSTDADYGFQKPLLSHRIRAFMTCSAAWSCERILEGLIVQMHTCNSDKQCWGFEWYFQGYVCQRGMPQVFVQIRSA